jgi:peptide/nickel transport system substrate-binding protein
LKKLLAGATSVALIIPLALASSATASPHSRVPAATPPNVTVVMGTTERIVALDPAVPYDLPSWTIDWNVFQTLIKYVPGTTTIVPDAAKCAWKGNSATVYVCTMLPNMYFSNGDPVTAQDAVYSIERVFKINSSYDPAALIPSFKSASASGNTVTFTLKYPQVTFPAALTDPEGSIVDPKVFPFNKALPDAKIVGSGPYELQSYTPNELAVLVANPHYGGTDVLHNNKFIIRYEESASTLVSDVEQGAVDIAYRSLSPTDLITLEHAHGVSVVLGKGIEIRYIAFNLKLMPGSTPAQKLAIRQAVAYLVNRQDIATNIYHGGVAPAYSIIPNALEGHINSFAQVYGASPNLAKAKAVLAAAGVTTPVKFTLWYNVNHYGDNDLATELQRQLDASGLFNVTLQTAEWSTYITAETTNGYAVALMGWFPDYPDADDYTGPFYLCNGFLNDHYCVASVTKGIQQEEGTLVPSARDAALKAVQIQTAKDAPLIPLWQGNQWAAQHGAVTGLASTLDPSYIFRMWLIGKA